MWDKIVAGPTTMLGSIGVAMAVPKNRESGWVEFVSSNAPGKRLDPESNEGRNSIQVRLDAMEAEFIGAVARFRDVSTDDVLSKFGAGDVLPAREAVRSGMADLVGGLKDALSLISPPQPPTKGVVMTNKTTEPENPGNTGDMVALAAITPDYIAQNFPEIASSMTKDSFNEGYKAGSETERARILGLEEVAMSGHEELLEQARNDGKSKAEEIARQHGVNLEKLPDHIRPSGVKGLDVESYLSGETIVDRGNIKSFLSQLQYPLYFLDYETINPAIPPFDGTRPYQQIPFQFSVHIQESPDADLVHHE